MFQQYENPSLMRIEKLLERLLTYFENTGNPEDREMVNDISKNLKKIKEEDNEMKGVDFLGR